MFVLCFVATMVCGFIVDQVWHNVYITVGLVSVMALSSGFLCAADEREGNG